MFSIVHWNCNSIKNKIELLKFFLSNNKPDVVFLNEIKCNKVTCNLLFNEIKNYKCIYKYREKNNGGGVALLIKDEIQYDQCYLFENHNTEIIGIKVYLKDYEFFIFSY